MELITFEHLSFQYPNSEKKALEDLCFSFEESGFYLICGPSGCGKSTLLRQIKKNLIPYGNREGSVRYLGQETCEMDTRESARQIGFVIQSPGEGIVTDKVWHELAFGLENLGIPQAEMKQRVAEMATFFGITAWFYKDVSELSGGQQQILNLASAMVTQPRVLLLDEPISQLDPLAAQEFLQMLGKINRDLGTTVLIVEHRLEELFSMADRICVMEEGRCVCFEEPQKTAEFFLRQAKETGEKVFAGLPAALRIACGRGEVLGQAKGQGLGQGQTWDQNQAQGQETLPLTIREGRLWMAERLQKARSPRMTERLQETGKTQMAERQQKARGAQARKAMSDLEAAFSGAACSGVACSGAACSGAGEKETKNSRDIALRCRDVAFSYGPQEPKVLRQVSLEIRRGEWFCIFGANGAGKSTLLGILCGNLTPQTGKLEILGKRVRGRQEFPLGYKKMALLPQDPKALFTEITVKEELEEALIFTDFSTEEKQRRVDEMLQAMELEAYGKSHPYDLSGGEQQRLALGKLLLLQPEMLLLDEPTKGLDPESRNRLGEFLRNQKEAGMTIVTVTHDLEFGANFADRCGLLFEGEMISAQEKHSFFRGNHFYTTAANQAARQWFPEAITCEEVLEQWRQWELT